MSSFCQVPRDSLRDLFAFPVRSHSFGILCQKTVSAAKNCHTRDALKMQTLSTKEDCVHGLILEIILKVWLYTASVASEAGLLKLTIRFLPYHSCHVGQGFSTFSENKNHLEGLLKHKFMNPNSRD